MIEPIYSSSDYIAKITYQGKPIFKCLYGVRLKTWSSKINDEIRKSTMLEF